MNQAAKSESFIVIYSLSFILTYVKNRTNSSTCTKFGSFWFVLYVYIFIYCRFANRFRILVQNTMDITSLNVNRFLTRKNYASIHMFKTVYTSRVFRQLDCSRPLITVKHLWLFNVETWTTRWLLNILHTLILFPFLLFHNICLRYK